MKDKVQPAERALFIIALIILMLSIAVALSGCSDARRMERKRAKAEALVKEAIETYPDIMRVKVQYDTIVMWTDPVAGAGQRTYSQSSMDSLAAICAEIVSRWQDKADSALALRSVVRLRNIACRFDTIKVDDGALSMLIWTGPDGIRYVYNVAPERVDTVVQSSLRTITTEPETIPTRVRSWWWVWVLVGMGGALVVYLWAGTSNDPDE